ncbi:MAG: signal recognition particle-docking protein FtsY [Nanoarchaeota archaeon]|nr:signal recognition particle-docking protein FtsY [Nanoarchaeota archaeon]
MFESLKKKFTSWMKTGKEKVKEKKTSKKKEKVVKDKKISRKESKKEDKKAKKKEIKEEVEEAEEIKEEEQEGFLEEQEKEEPILKEVSEEEESEDGEIAEQVEEEVKEEVEEKPEEKQGFFARLAKKITTSELGEEDFNDFFNEFELTLLENNVALEVVDKLRELLSKELVGKRFKSAEAERRIGEALKRAIEGVLVESINLVDWIKGSGKRPFVILFFGINGSGKTTTIAKMAYKLKKEGLSCVLAAGDTFRAASIEQLQIHGEKIGVEVIAQNYMSDPAAVAFDAIQYAKKNHIDVVLIDTAGRMHTKENLLREMEKIVRISQPDLKLFVGESITGNDVIEQAKKFKESVGIDGMILTKADVDEKAGAILSVGYVTGKPIYFLGIGQGYDDLQQFKKKTVLKNLGLEE